MSDTCTARTALLAGREGGADDASGSGKQDARANADATATVAARRHMEVGFSFACGTIRASDGRSCPALPVYAVVRGVPPCVKTGGAAWVARYSDSGSACAGSLTAGGRVASDVGPRDRP